MSDTQSLLALLEEQRLLHEKIAREAGQIHTLDYVSRNAELEGQLAAHRQELEELRSARRELEGENRQLKDTLVGQAYSRTAVAGGLSRDEMRRRAASSH